MTPRQLAQMVINRQFLSTVGAGKALPRRVRHVHLNTSLGKINIDTLHRPRLAQPNNCRLLLIVQPVQTIVAVALRVMPPCWLSRRRTQPYLSRMREDRLGTLAHVND